MLPDNIDDDNEYCDFQPGTTAQGGYRPQQPHPLTTGTRVMLTQIAHLNPKNRSALKQFSWSWCLVCFILAALMVVVVSW